MQLFYVTVETRSTCRITVAAKNELEASADAIMISGPGAKCLQVVQASYTVEAQAHEALAHLLVQNWLHLDDQPATIGDWLNAARREPATRDKINAKLALAGLRLMDNADLIIASPRTIPLLKRWFASTPWDEAALFAALLTLPGARREGPRYYAGAQSRGVRVPARVVFADEEVAE